MQKGQALSTESVHVDQDINIRPAGHGDLEALQYLDCKVFEELAYPHFVLRQLFDVHRDCWLVAEDASGLIGYSLGVPTWDHKLAWLLALAVVPEHRRLGYGRRLTLASITLLRSMRVQHVYLTVEPGNDIAIHLYEQCGFTSTGWHQNYLGPGEDRVIMTRPLATSESNGMEQHLAGRPCQVPAQVDTKYADRHLQ